MRMKGSLIEENFQALCICAINYIAIYDLVDG